jgi:hypothetical protein
VGKAYTSASVCSVTGVDALLERGDVVLLDNVVTLIVQIAGDLVILPGSIVKGGAVDRRARSQGLLSRSVQLDGCVDLVFESCSVERRVGDFVLGIAKRRLVGAAVSIRDTNTVQVGITVVHTCFQVRVPGQATEIIALIIHVAFDPVDLLLSIDESGTVGTRARS